MPEHILTSDAVASIRDIAAHYEMSELAIGDFFDLVLNGQSPHPHLFVSESRKDIKLLAQERLAENNRLASLALLTFMEAVFMADYDRRVHKRERTDLGRAFRALNKECENNRRLGKGKASPSFQYDILELWKKHNSETKSKISDFKKMFEYRHWLAHGRQFLFKQEWKKYNFQAIYTLATDILEFF